jgi:hypothetical protein
LLSLPLEAVFVWTAALACCLATVLVFASVLLTQLASLVSKVQAVVASPLKHMLCVCPRCVCLSCCRLQALVDAGPTPPPGETGAKFIIRKDGRRINLAFLRDGASRALEVRGGDVCWL